MSRQHHPHARVLGAPVRIPQPLEDGKVRCNGCSAVVSVTKNGHLRKHNTPAGEPCAYRVTYAEPVDVDLPPVVLPERKGNSSQARRARGEASRLDAGSECKHCGKWLPGERSVCGACYIAKGGR